MVSKGAGLLGCFIWE